MVIKTAEILVNETLQEAIIHNWKGNERAAFQSEILDNEIQIPQKKLEVTLRIPYKSRGDLSHMLIRGNLVFLKKKNQLFLRIDCKILKPIVISFFLGSLTSLIFVLPIVLLNSLNWYVVFLVSLMFSGIHFGLTYLRIKRLSTSFLKELKKKSST